MNRATASELIVALNILKEYNIDIRKCSLDDIPFHNAIVYYYYKNVNDFLDDIPVGECKFLATHCDLCIFNKVTSKHAICEYSSLLNLNKNMTHDIYDSVLLILTEQEELQK